MSNDNEEETLPNKLPPMVCLNFRIKIKGAEIPIDIIKLKHKGSIKEDKQLILNLMEPSLSPVPQFPLFISWTPEQLEFRLNEDSVVATLRVRNHSMRPVYIQCCGLWGDNSRLGASWCAYPRTRLWLSPGLKVDLHVQATPRSYTPIKSSYSSLQVAAAHLRDSVTGYFAIPINVTFLKYEPSSVNESVNALL